MCYDCGSVPVTNFGCIAGNVTDYCYIFGNNVSKIEYTIFLMMTISWIFGLFTFFYYLYNKNKLKPKGLNTRETLNNKQ